MKRSIYVGWDPREETAYSIAVRSVQRHLSSFIPIHGLLLDDLVDRGLYTRPTERRVAPSGQTILWDVLSDAPMSTQHANARFLTKRLAGSGWALFMDGDMMARADLTEMFDGLDPSKAVYCVQHQVPQAAGQKMDGQVQTAYARKNWSSFLVFNCDHPANRALTIEMVNSLPGRDLHRLCWLEDADIGALDPAWNFLVGHTDPTIDPKVVHFTDGVPDMLGYENAPFADEWRAERMRSAA